MRRYQHKYQPATAHRPKERCTQFRRPPEAKHSGELEINTLLRLSSLSGKALAVSKSISRIYVFLEIMLEKGDGRGA